MIYTYRGGKKLELAKRPDAFVARASPQALQVAGICDDPEPVSSASCRVRARAQDLDSMMARSRALGPTHHAYTTADTGEDFLITDRIFVTFNEVLTAEQVAAFAGHYGLLLRERYTDRDYLFQLTDHSAMNPVKLVVELTENEPLVALAENDLNYVVTKYEIVPPSDPDYARQWHLHGHFVHPDVDPRANVRCEQAWSLLGSFGSPQVVVGVTDDGCKLDHPDFDAPGKFAAWGYFNGTRLITSRDIDAVPTDMYQNGANHGTSCAGVIAGEVDGVLTVGAAPACRLLPIKWESQGPSLLVNDSKMLTALAFVGDKVDVLSNSWGSVPRFLFATVVINRISQLATTGGRRGRGILFLWAAGNENCPIMHETDVDVPYTHGWQLTNGSWHWTGPQTTRRFVNNMVDVPGLMHVAALASTAQRSHYSNYGHGIEICAPSSNSHAYFRMQVRGQGITTTTGETGHLTHEFGGTSSATPLVAGLAALVLSAHPELSALEVGSILRATASKDLDETPYPRTPPANFDPTPSWDVSPVAPFDKGSFTDISHADGTWSPWFGHGRADAEQAVALALRLRRGGEGGADPAPAPEHRLVSRPALAIPDNRAGGVVDTLEVTAVGQVSFLRIAVDIRHSYIGDLVVSLTAPSGHEVVLHDRAGGSRNDLSTTWEAATLPALRGFEGEASEGLWTLSVRDEAAADTGRLEEWSLEVGVIAPPRSVFAEDAPGTAIPDNHPPGIERILAVADAGLIAGLEVAVDITHTYIGDLRITLRSPGGTTVVLHDRSGGTMDNLRATYASADVAALQALAGESCAGDWRLQVQDLAARDVGKLNRWSLDIALQAAAPATTRSAKKATTKGKSPPKSAATRAKATKPKRTKAKVA